MKNTLFSLLLALPICASAQTTGKFYINLNADKKPVVNSIENSNTNSKYQKLVLSFPKSIENTKITIHDAPDKVTSVFKNYTIKALADGSDDEVSVITISGANGNYTIEGYGDVNIPPDFVIAFGSNETPVFHLSAASSPAGPTGLSKASPHQPGHILYDAIYISEHWKAQKPDTAKLILKAYGINNATDLQKNNYLNNALSGLYELPKEVEAEGAGGLNPANLLSSIGGLDVTNIADGFAKFIVARTKQELSTAFFNEFKNVLMNPEYVDLRTVFPQTYRALSVIGDEIYMYQAYLQTLRESFENDLANLPSNLPTIIDNHADFFEKNKDLKAMLQSAFYIAQQMQDDQHPGNIIADYPVQEFLADNGVNPNIVASFQTMQLLSESFQSNSSSDRYWADKEDIRKLFSEDLIFSVYMGLLIETAKKKGIQFDFGNQDALHEILNDSQKYYTSYRSFIKTAATKLQTVEEKIGGLKNVSGDSLKLESYYGIVMSSLDLMEYLTDFEKLPPFQNMGIHQSVEEYFYVARTSATIVIDVNRRNYGSAIVNAVALYDTVFGVTGLKNMAPAAASAKEKTAFAADEKEKYDASAGALFKYGSFMSAMVMAKNSDEVEAAIEAIALPSGSATIKRNAAFNVSLNAYCGLFGGYEHIEGVASARKFNTYGVTAPIGFSISKGRSCFLPVIGSFWNTGHFSNSLFISVVDIGALTAFRFADDSTETVPKIELKNIISPGIFYSWGIAKTPVSVNIGYQFGPLLRKVTATSNDIGTQYTRFSVSLCVDLPLWNIYTWTGKPRH